MSGFEVVGIVLGSIPIVVSALEYYMRGLSTLQTFRNYKRVLNKLILNLNTEYFALQDICEKLLVGIAPHTQIEEMIRDPFGESWRDAAMVDKLRLRLWTSFEIFDQRIQDVKEAVEEMMEKLNISADGKVKWAKSSSIKKQLKRAMFILQMANYSEVLTRIRDGVSALHRLVVLNADLESERKPRSQARLYRLVNETLSSVYHALQSTMACQCTRLHDVGLRLTPPSRNIIPGDDDEDIIQELQFRLAVSYSAPSQFSSFKQWNEILLKSCEGSRKPTASFATQNTTSRKKIVEFAISSPTASTVHKKQSTQASVIAQSPTVNLVLSTAGIRSKSVCSRHISNLCEAMQWSGKKKQGEKYGHIQDFLMQEARKYDVYTLDYLGAGNEWVLVPLKKVLQDPTFLFADKLRMAWVIACSVLQMQSTPWVTGVPSSDNIYIAQEGGVLQFQHVFVRRHFPERSAPVALLPTPSLANPFMLYLGILLIEVILGQPLTDLISDQDQDQALGPDLAKYILDYEAANKLLGRVMMFGGYGCYNAVERCLRSNMYKLNLADSPDSKDDLIFAIVNPLEQELKRGMI
ncbi:hypothetical protein FSARC_7475 [Fusarium sarcochroum]|uniref:DUF7580 domain-containing protein n=1 Tax=Fusarium sarcochroum TaxID=1208366 RepID=A0A8H4TUY8_9HYPO|nr:hypothetical protein FSARC_7475 [Fusarium sarcochroum]